MKSNAEKIIIHTDGGARGNPGPAGLGVVIADADGTVLKRVAEALGERTNNWAEYEAIARALEELKKHIPKEKRRTTSVEIYSDSELVIKQLRGEYQVKEESLFPQFMKIWNMRVAHFPTLSFVHVPREENKEADRLANKAMDEASTGNETLL